jgi:hypothetical protein
MTYQLDELLTFKEIAKRLPTRRNGRPVSSNTIFRWASNGCRGIKLQYVQVGANKCSTLKMVEEFFAALAQQYEAGRPTVSMPEPIRLPAERQRAIDAAKRRLQAAGV